MAPEPTPPPLHVRTWSPAPSVRPGLTGAALLLHGAESHAGWFAAVGAHLAQAGLRAVAYDRRGWGQSPGERGRLASADAALDELAALAARLRALAGPVHLVGLSWGGLLAAVARARHGALYASVTLVAPALRPLRRPSAAELTRAVLGGRAMLPLVPSDFTARPEQLRFVAGDPHRTHAVDWGFCRATVALRAALAEPATTAPPLGLLLAGIDDVVDGAFARRFVEARGGDVRVFPVARHSLVLEEPAGVAEAVLAQARAAPAAGAPRHAS